MAVKKKASKKKAAKKRVVRRKVVAKKRAAAKSVVEAPSISNQLKAAKAENRELAKQVRASDRQVKALLKLLESCQTDATKFLTRRVKDAVAKYGVAIAPKKRRRRAKKKAAKK